MKSLQIFNPLITLVGGLPQVISLVAVSSVSFLLTPATATAQTVIEDAPPSGIAFGTTQSCDAGNFLIRSFEVPDDFVVGNITVGLNLSRDPRGNIAGILQRPNGDFSQFFGIGGDGNANFDVLFEDGGGALDNGIDDDVSAPFYERSVNTSINPLSSLTGQSSQGTWNLFLCSFTDTVAGTYNRSQLTLLPGTSISGSVFDDVVVNNTQNGTRDGDEVGLANIGISIYQDDGDGIFEPGAGDSLLTSLDTGTDGEYSAILPEIGDYWIEVDETDPDLAGRTYGGSTETGTENPRFISSQGTSLENVDFPFIQDLDFLCPVGSPTQEIAFVENFTLESGTDLQVGAVYRFANVFANVDALIEIASFNNGASLASIDNDTTGVLAAFQPTLNAVSGATSSVDFDVTLVISGTTTPVAFTFLAAGVDIDGAGIGSGLREFIELTELSDFEFFSPTTLAAIPITSGNRFESTTEDFQPGVSATATETLVIAEYDRVSNFRYSIGAFSVGTTGATQRLNSLFLGCTAGPITAEVLVVKRITAINGNRLENPNDNTPLDAVVNDGVDNSADDNADWPTNFLVGAINGGNVNPGDELEYTVYFINPGGTAAPNVRLCDLVPENQTFVSEGVNSNDIEISIGGVVNGLSATSDTVDRAEVTLVDSLPTNAGCNLPSGAEGADEVVVLDITGDTGLPNNLETLPRTTGQGTPNNAFGFFRYTTRID